MDATKKISKNLGGDRLGSGSKNNISLHAYNRSTHDLSRAWRSSMTVGALVPFMKEVALPGDTWSINLEAIARTTPTIGPLYGSYKMQLDVFECPIRLYNGLLHNNMTKIGMKMEGVKIPWINVNGMVRKPNISTQAIGDDYQIAADSLLKYLGISGICDARNYPAGQDEYAVTRMFNAIPLLAYWDIYKQYYANKQEEKGAVIGAKQVFTTGQIEDIVIGYGQNLTDWWEVYEVGQWVPSSYTAINNYQAIKQQGAQYPIFADGFACDIDTTGNVSKDMLYFIYQKPDNSIVGVLANTVGKLLIQGNTISFWDYDGSLNGFKFIGIDFRSNLVVNSKIDVQTFDLANIDDARINILRDTGLNNRLQIDHNWPAPYDMYSSVTLDGQSANSLPLWGLALKTYQSDLFENWLKTEWIDGIGGINEITAVDTSSGSFQIDALNLANKVYNMLNRIAVSGGSYEDYIEAVYSTEANRRAESPIYKGGMSSEIVFEEVVSTSNTENQPLGTLAGKGIVSNKKGGHIEIRVDEPSYIIGIISITPRVDYSQGNDWDMTELDTLADLHKPALDGIGFEDLLQERMAWFGTVLDISTGKFNKLAAGKVPAWINYMTSVNKTFGDFAKTKAMFMTLNRRYEQPTLLNQRGIQDLTTYIDPRKYNYNFAQISLDAENFWVQIGAKVEVRRVMSAKIIPNL